MDKQVVLITPKDKTLAVINKKLECSYIKDDNKYISLEDVNQIVDADSEEFQKYLEAKERLRFAHKYLEKKYKENKRI